MKKVLVLAGGFPQIALIEELKTRGYYVILADWNEEPIAKKYADFYYKTSTLDIPTITEIAKNERISFLITACTDQALLTVAKVSEDLGLPCYIDYMTALNVTNKACMKKIFIDNQIPTALHTELSILDDLKIEKFEFPLIVKPVDCNSSKGVKRVDCYSELVEAFHEAVKLSRTNTAIIEEFIEGLELSVDVYVERGKAHILCISNNDKIYSKDKFIIFRGRCPAKEAKPVQEKIEKITQMLVNAFHLKNSPMLIQMITDGENVYVLEFSARTGGGTKPLRIKQFTGFDVIKSVVDLTEGYYPHVEVVRKEFFLADEFIYCNPGRFERLDGFDEMKKAGVIQDYYQFKSKGDVFDRIENSGNRVAGFTIIADSYEQLQRKHLEVAKRIRVLDENGIDMMRHDLLADIS